jgi:hypothetical protein
MAAPSTTRAARAQPRTLPRLAPLLPLLVFVAMLALYLATLTGVHTFDALSYILDVQRKPWRELFHPHHLAYGPVGWAVYHAARALGYNGTAHLPLQLLNALAGALGVALFFALLRYLLRRTDLALACAALLGCSYAFWYYAVEVEVYTLAALFLIACLAQIARLLQQPTPRGWALLGALQGGAVLFHQTNVLLCAPVLVAALVATRRQGVGFSVRATWRLIRQVLMPYGLTLALIVGLPYLAVAALSGLTSWGSLRGWLLSYAETGWWGGPLTSSKWADLGTGLRETLAERGGALLGLWLVGLACICLARWMLMHRAAHTAQRAPSLTSALALVAAIWLVVYGAFFLWWEPDNIEFWIASLPPALLLFGLALRVGERGWRQRWGTWTALAVALTLGVVNGEAIAARGDLQRDLQRQIVDRLVAASGPDDVLLVPDGLQELYLPYYAGRFTAYSWNQAFYDHGPRWADVCGAVQARVDAGLHAGTGVVFADEVLRPPSLLLRRHNVTQAQVDACLQPYLVAAEPLPMPSGVQPAQRLADATTQAERGWRFDAFAWGWRGANLADQRFANGWSFVPGPDPALTSPRLALDAARYRAVEIVLDAGGATGEAQLFWADADRQLSEDRSLRFPLEPLGLHTYRLDLAALPAWNGTIGGLRLDPVALGQGQTMRLVALRLVP